MKATLFLALALFVAGVHASSKWELGVTGRHLTSMTSVQYGSPLAAAAKYCKAFAGLVAQASPELVSLLGQSSCAATIFCPTDAAIAKANLTDFPAEDVLRYHVVRGAALHSKDLVNLSPINTEESLELLAVTSRNKIQLLAGLSYATVIKADIIIGESIIHVIDTVMLPNLNPYFGKVSTDFMSPTNDFPPPSPGSMVSPPPPAPTCTTVYAALCSNPGLTILKAAVDAAGLKDTLDSYDFVGTIFAPSDAAIKASPAYSQLNTILANKDLLVELLRNHVIQGAGLLAKQLPCGSYLGTAGDSLLEVSKDKGAYSVGLISTSQSYQVVTADIQLCQAVVHVIDGLLISVNF